LVHSRRAQADRKSAGGATGLGADMFGFGKRTVRSALLALLCVATVACGGGDESSSSASNSGSSSAPPATPAPPPPPPSGGARAATLEWQAPDTATDGSTLTNLAGYRIYYGTDVAQMTKTINVTNPGVLTYVVEDLAPATYYFAVTAIDSMGHESERSNAGQKIIS
jgi:hypothetical protein